MRLSNSLLERYKETVSELGLAQIKESSRNRVDLHNVLDIVGTVIMAVSVWS
jgi:hypothetical protein